MAIERIVTEVGFSPGEPATARRRSDSLDNLIKRTPPVQSVSFLPPEIAIQRGRWRGFSAINGRSAHSHSPPATLQPITLRRHQQSRQHLPPPLRTARIPMSLAYTTRVNCAETTITLCADNVSAHNAFYVKYQSITLRSQSLQRHINVAATTRPLR